MIADVDPPVVNPELTLHAFLSPEDAQTIVWVGQTAPIYKLNSNPIEFLSDAIVIISNDAGKTDTLKADFSKQVFSISSAKYPIEGERTYTITAIQSGKTVKGSTTVPKSITNIDTATVQNIALPNEDPKNRYVVSWNDQGGVKNYYRVWIKSTTDYTQVSQVYDDKYDDGKKISISLDDYYYSWGGGDKFDVYLLNVDKAYYEYHIRIANSQYESPFSEPVPLYSNTIGGVGLVSSFRKTKVQIKL